ncbi:MAG: iron ABC transporter permease [Verrucomicrobiota bacterium]
MSKSLSIGVFAFTVAFLLTFFVYPIWITIREAFIVDGEFTPYYFLQVFQNPLYLEGLKNAFLIGLFTTVGSLILSIPLAVVSNRFLFPGKTILSTLVLIPLILPPFVGAIGVKQILGQNGAFNVLLSKLGLMDMNDPTDWLGEGRLLGIVIMNALHLYPILYLNVTAALANLDPAMEEAAENLGCPAWKRFLKITLPLTMPGIFAGGTIVFIWSFTELGVPLIFDFTRVTSVQIFDGIKDIGGNPLPYALVAVLLVTTVIIFAISKLLFGRSHFTMSGRASMASYARRLPAWQGFLCSAAFCFVIFLAVIPHIGVVLNSVAADWYKSIFPESYTLAHFNTALGHELTVPSIGNSLKYASLSTLFDILLGLGIAYVVVRTTLPGRQILDSLAMLPLAVPGLVLAFGYLAMTREGQPFAWLMPNENPTMILVVAYAVRRLPYVVRSAAAGYQQTSVTLEEAAQNLGASPVRALQRITIPLIAANLIAGGLLAFAFAMLEVSDSLILAQKQEFYPITKAIYALYSSLGDGPYLASALGVWAMIFLAITIIGAGLMLGKRLGALFRI